MWQGSIIFQVDRRDLCSWTGCTEQVGFQPSPLGLLPAGSIQEAGKDELRGCGNLKVLNDQELPTSLLWAILFFPIRNEATTLTLTICSATLLPFPSLGNYFYFKVLFNKLDRELTWG